MDQHIKETQPAQCLSTVSKLPRFRIAVSAEGDAVTIQDVGATMEVIFPV